MYLGDQVQLVAALANGTEFVVREQRASADTRASTAIHPGDRITVQWDEGAPLLLGDAPTRPQPQRRMPNDRPLTPS